MAESCVLFLTKDTMGSFHVNVTAVIWCFFANPLSTKGNRMWKQKYLPVAGLISANNKGTCKTQPQTRYMVCLNYEGGSQFSKSSGLKTIPLGVYEMGIHIFPSWGKESWSVNPETWVLVPGFLLTTYETLGKALNISGTNLPTWKIRWFDSITVSLCARNCAV